MHMTDTADAVVGRNVHILMWRSGMPQRTLALALDIDQSALSKKLHGRRTWTVDELLATAVVLQVSVAELLPGAEYEPRPAGRGRTVEHL